MNAIDGIGRAGWPEAQAAEVVTQLDVTQTGAVARAVAPEHFKRGMRRLASGVSLITTAVGEERYGLVATAVTSLSAEPSSLLICVGKSVSAHPHLDTSDSFCVNVLSATQEDIAARFSHSVEREKRFDSGTWRTLRTGAPALVGSLVTFDCEVQQKVSYFSHTVFFAAVVAVEIGAGQVDPLLHLDGSFRRLAGAGPR
jgi:flavin reductase